MILETAIEPIIGGAHCGKYVAWSRRADNLHGPEYLHRSPILPTYKAAVAYEAKVRNGHLPPILDTTKPAGWP